MAIELVKSSHYRIPFQGSKNLICENLLNEMVKYKPDAVNFVDLFGGGGAMSCYALECGFKVYYNEIRREIQELLEFCIETNELEDTNSIWWDFVSSIKFRWVKYDFKPKDRYERIYQAFVLLCYSFGNNFGTYLSKYDKEVEKFYGHRYNIRCDSRSLYFYYKILGDNAYYLELLLKEKFSKEPDYYKRYRMYRDVVIKVQFLNSLNEALTIDFEELLNMGQRELLYSRLGREDKPKRIETSIDINYLQQIPQINRVHTLRQLNELKHNIEFTSLDYEEAWEKVKGKITKENSIIYCDSPYKGTRCYRGAVRFDFKRYQGFLDRLNEEGWVVFFSEYTNYDNKYKEIYSEKKRMNANADKTAKYQVEKLFINSDERAYIKREYPLLDFLEA